jgi:hypothetical protein
MTTVSAFSRYMQLGIISLPLIFHTKMAQKAPQIVFVQNKKKSTFFIPRGGLCIIFRENMIKPSSSQTAKKGRKR